MAWNESLNIEVPKEWIEPTQVVSLLPPYYGRIVEDYVSWLEQPHSSLRHLSWGAELDFMYRPLNPNLREREEADPTTYFVYEAIYTFFAGMATGLLQPNDQLESSRASTLRRQIVNNVAEVMQFIAELGTGRASFDQTHNPNSNTYRLLQPITYDKGRKQRESTFVGKAQSAFKANFRTQEKTFNLGYQSLDVNRFFPAEIDGERSSFFAQLRLDRSRVAPDERRLTLDCDISRIPWESTTDGKILPAKGFLF